MTSEQGSQQKHTERFTERVTIVMTREQRERLEAVASELDRSISYVLRCGLDMALEQHERGGVARGTVRALEGRQTRE